MPAILCNFCELTLKVKDAILASKELNSHTLYFLLDSSLKRSRADAPPWRSLLAVW